MKKLTRDETERALKEPNGPQKLMEKADAAFDAAWALFYAQNAAAGAFLCRCAKKKEFRDRIFALIEKNDKGIMDNLSSSDPKLRKNTARLLGELSDEAFAPLLSAALLNEETRFVRPSMILALGAAGGELAKKALEEYIAPPPLDESEKKHYAEEAAALKAALTKLSALEKHAFTGLGRAYEIELRAPDKLGGALQDELISLGLKPTGVFSAGVRLQTDDYVSLFRARCFFEALFPMASGVGVSPEAITKRAKPFMTELLTSSHQGEGAFGYRIEIRGGTLDRGAFARALAEQLDSPEPSISSSSFEDKTQYLVNSPGGYEAELRMEIKDHGKADLYVKLYSVSDMRFAYRLEALPASMHPVTAAAILRLSSAYLSEGARVLDPCCGSGTFLFEREKHMPVASITGVDVSHKAVEIARKNAIAADSRAKFIVNDCLRFEVKRPYDELVANLPFGNRVGTHKDNEALYAGILDALPRWIRSGGVAILYTMEFTLLKRLIRERPGLCLMKEARTDAGGLTPAIFILRIQ